MTAWHAVRHQHAPDTRTDDWRARALCADLLDDTMYPDPSDTVGIETARRVCEPCPVRAQCLTTVLTDEGDRSADGRFGIAAGTTPRQRWAIYNRIRKAAVGMSAVDVERDAPTLADVLRANTVPSTGGHLVWTGRSHLRIGRRYLTRNRIAFEVLAGRVPYGEVRRQCETPDCVAHLGDQADRAERDGRAAA